jgi:Aminotransferase class-V
LARSTPVRPIADLVHSKGAKLLVDGVLGLGHVPTDLKAMDCDFYAAGFHKFACGPRATAVFYVRPNLVGQLPPLFGNFNGIYTLVAVGSGFTSIVVPPGGGSYAVYNSPTTITISNNLVADGNGNLLPLPATPPGAVVSFLIGGFPCIFDLRPERIRSIPMVREQ